MIKKLILGGLALIVIVFVAFCVVVAMQPADLKIMRAATFSAPPAAVFEQVNDFHKWDAWSPWAKIDPTMKVTHSGSPSGTGAAYAWTGTGEAGEGKMTIKESHPTEHIGIDLEFIKPFPANNVIDFTFKPNGDKTDVTWTMTGKKDFVMKAFCLVMDMDKMIGADFEKGLAQLKPIVESAAKATP